MKLYYYITSLFCLVTMLYLANIEDTNLAQIVEFGVLTIVNLILGVHYSLLEKIDSLNNNSQK
jgi:hypothetical protein